MRTVRAPELASGCLRGMPGHLMDAASNAVLSDPGVVALGPGSSAHVLRDFAMLRRHATFTLHLKFGLWSRHPWVFAGLAHKLPEIASRNRILQAGLLKFLMPLA